MLFDFESDGALDALDWRCRTLYALSRDHAAHGDHSLKMSLYPSDYPGFHAYLSHTRWRGYGALRFQLFNPSEVPVPLTLRIDDREDSPGYGDRFQRRIVAEPGETTVTVSLAELVTSGGGRPLDLGNIVKLMLFAHRPERVTVLYLDHVRLTGAGG